MAIQNDPLNREWVEASTENKELIDAARSALISFLSFDKDRMPAIVGTGFLIAATTEFGVLLTAKHVLTEGVSSTQQPHAIYANSALFVPAGRNSPSLDPNKLKAIWMDDLGSEALNIIHANYNDVLDIACCITSPQVIGKHKFNPREIPIDTTVPRVGDFVNLVSFGAQAVTELEPPQEKNGKDQKISIERRVTVRAGTVTGVYPNGYRQYKWPCFTTSIPAEPGMSGGFVSIFRPNGIISACGIVCADNSSEESRSDFFKCGESVIALSWTSLGLRLPKTIPPEHDDSVYTLHHLMSIGNIHTAIGGIEHIEISDLSDDSCRISIREPKNL